MRAAATSDEPGAAGTMRSQPRASSAAQAAPIVTPPSISPSTSARGRAASPPEPDVAPRSHVDRAEHDRRREERATGG